MSVRSWCVAVLCLAFALDGRAVAAPDGALDPGRRALTATWSLSATGDATIEAKVRFPDAEMEAVKATSPDPRRFFERMCPSRPDYVMDANPTVAYADGAAALTAKGTLRGFARHRGAGAWEADLGRAFVEGAAADGGRAWEFAVAGRLDGENVYAGRVRVVLPDGAKAVAWDASAHRLTWSLPILAAAGAGAVGGRVECAPRVISAAYKVYTLAKGFSARRVPLADGSEIVFGADMATPWVGRVVLTNPGPGAVKDLRVRWKLEDYTAEWSAAEKFPGLLPGQTAVSVYYPVIQPSIARLRDDTKANLHVKWSWTDEAGKTHEDDDAGRITLLGVNNFAFSDLGLASQFGSFAELIRNGPLLAAWVSRNDGVVTQFGAMANKNAGGVAASVSDDNALKAMQACYELMLINNLTYQSPPATVRDRGKSFDASVVQTVRFPRDVIKNRSGTCIDLAILYAAMLNAVGLNPMLVLIDGHCFPAAILPSGGIVAVESTGVAGGLAGGFMPFAKVLELGTKEFADARRSGRYMLVPVQEMWEAEILTPELEELPADILQRWGITGTLPTAGAGGTAPTPGPGAAPGGGPRASPTAGPKTAPPPDPAPPPGGPPTPAPAGPPAGLGAA
ncbi:MAG: hypothetical protein JNM10_20125, partial [Planctomycetia bacterium]|nr:hypothetical protein [Planctomycetia bacterium]